MKNIFFFLIVFNCYQAFSQNIKVANIKAVEENNAIVIYYDLNGAKPEQRFTVSLHYSTDGGLSYSESLLDCTGNIGMEQTGGPGKKIIWEVLNYRTQFVVDNVIFKVKAELQLPYEPEMVYVDGGTFMMGNDAGGEDEKPAHNVKISSFYMSKYEISIEAYLKFCNENKKELPHPEYEWNKKLKNPVVYVNWYDANEFCNWLSKKTNKKYRLPTEAQWEYAAKGGNKGSGFKYSGSNVAKEVGWNKNNSAGTETTESGKLSPNELGIYDLTGNVWEWCNDWYLKTYYSNSSTNNPQGPQNGVLKVGKGGSWRDVSVYNSYRFFCTPTMANNYLGFRVVCEP